MSNVYQLENSVWPTLVAEMNFNSEESLYNSYVIGLKLNKGQIGRKYLK